MAKMKTCPVIAVVHAERLYELMGTGMVRADAAAQNGMLKLPEVAK